MSMRDGEPFSIDKAERLFVEARASTLPLCQDLADIAVRLREGDSEDAAKRLEDACMVLMAQDRACEHLLRLLRAALGELEEGSLVMRGTLQ